MWVLSREDWLGVGSPLKDFEGHGRRGREDSPEDWLGEGEVSPKDLEGRGRPGS